ncbi:MAG: glucose-1-phosphate adenylyltransferase subunit GlgD [Eubacteriales bacterium]
MIKDVFGLIYAGEQNMNLRELVILRSVGAVPIAGRYRALDFVLSNMVNSNIRNIGIIAQKNYHSLMDHLGSGKDWDLNRKSDGLFILPPFDTNENRGSYRGLCDAVKGAMNYIVRTSQKYCLLCGSYTIYNETYDRLLDYHINSGADITMLYNVEENPEYTGERFKDTRIIMDDETGRVIDMELNPSVPRSNKIGMDIYLIRKDLLEYLIEDAVLHGNYNFVMDVLIPNINSLKIYAIEHKGYVGRLHSVAAYFKMNMDFLKNDVQQDLFLSENRIFTKIKDEAPVKFSKDAKIKNSFIANGCIIKGEVENSIIFRGVHIDEGVSIKNSIIMQDSHISSNCSLEYVILDKIVHMREGRKLIGDENFPVVIRKGAMV